jgi:cytochrome oxidase Cu insertion factor (SCO1/SenC/PrrC family)
MRIFIACSLLFTLLSCIQSEDGLNSNCFNWPEEAFTPTNSATLTVALKEGEPAVDFTLRDPNGEGYTLSSLLATKPVLLVFGAFT